MSTWLPEIGNIYSEEQGEVKRKILETNFVAEGCVENADFYKGISLRRHYTKVFDGTNRIEWGEEGMKDESRERVGEKEVL